MCIIRLQMQKKRLYNTPSSHTTQKSISKRKRKTKPKHVNKWLYRFLTDQSITIQITSPINILNKTFKKNLQTIQGHIKSIDSIYLNSTDVCKLNLRRNSTEKYRNWKKKKFRLNQFLSNWILLKNFKNHRLETM